jgi:phospholipid-translocating P-type ATPase (flippase)
MYDETTDTPAKARTSVLSEELGMIQYVLSDKTGTLTQNSMQFAGASIDGKVYGLETSERPVEPYPDSPHAKVKPSFHDEGLFQDIRLPENTNHWKFMLNLSLCHTVIPVHVLETTEPTAPSSYHAESPDEAALVAAARDLGVSYFQRTNEGVMSLLVFGSVKHFLHLHTIEFSSSRKRMTTILQEVNSDVNPVSPNVTILVKGADDIILDLCEFPDPGLRVSTQEHLDAFARQGLRTLVMGCRSMAREEYDLWAKRWHSAALETLSGRGDQAQTDRLAAEIESGLKLSGATAVIDKLQEGVPETIASMKRAGINVWVLTGDKQETAVRLVLSSRPIRQHVITNVPRLTITNCTCSIAFTCNLLDHNMELLYCNVSKGWDETQVCEYLSPLVKRVLEKPDERFGVVVDGQSLRLIFEQEGSTIRFFQIVSRSVGVVCNRCSPLQKAKMVQLVRKRLHAVTMAIGDGANDVSMIKEADVGVGISGKEGMQAVMASDYAIAQFRFLKRLVFWHGRTSYNRITWMILYFFYKVRREMRVMCPWCAPL